MQVIHRVGLQFRERVELIPVMWEREPLLASGHFQESLDPRDSDIMVCILWSRMGSPLPPEFVEDGIEEGITGTGWEFKVAVESHDESGTPEILVYRKTAPLTTQIISGSEEHLKAISDQQEVNRFFSDNFHNDDENKTFKRAYFQFDEIEQFELKLEEHLYSLVKAKLTSELSEGQDAQHITWFQGSPYRGLCAFELEHKDVFFGRTKPIGDIVTYFKQNNEKGLPFLMLLGMSGSGKSSLMNAGLLPLYLSPRVIDYDVGHVELIRIQPGKIDRINGFLRGFCQAIVDSVPEFVDAELDGEVFLEQLSLSPKSFALTVNQAIKAIREKKTLHPNVKAKFLLVIDQTEELYTTDEVSPEEQSQFWELVHNLIQSGGFWCIGTMRTDFVGMASGSKLIELMRGEGQYTLQPFKDSELEQIMVQPAKAAGLHFEKNEQGVSLASVIRDDCRGQPGVLPLLEFCLDELYKLRDENKNALTFAAYHEELGGLIGAIARKADAVLEHFNQEFDADSVLPNVLNNLIAFNPDNSEAQASAKYADLDSFPVGTKERRLVESLVEERLLIQTEGKVRVAHEAIISHWRRVQQWLAIDIEFQLWRARTQREAVQWITDNKLAERLLPSGKPLTDAVTWLNSRRHNIEEDIVAYIEASQRRESRRKRLVSWGAGALVLVISLFATYSFWQYNVASEQRNIALTNQSQFLAELVRQKNAETQYDTSLLLGLNGLPGDYGGERPWIDELAVQVGIAKIYNHKKMVLPLESLVNDACISTEGDLIAVVSANGQATIWSAQTGENLKEFIHTSALSKINFAKDDNALFLASVDGTIFKWDVLSGDTLFTVNNDTQVLDLALSEDGNWLVAGLRGNNAAVIDANTGEVALKVRHDDVIQETAISRDNRFIATASSDGTGKIWERAGGELVHTVDFERRVETVQFHPNGQLVAFGSYDSTAVLVDAFTGRSLFDVKINGKVWNISFSAQGDKMAVSGEQGTIYTYSVPDGELISEKQHQDSVYSIEFDVTGNELISASRDNSVIRWDILNGHKLQVMSHLDDVLFAKYLPNSEMIVAGGYDGEVTVWEKGTDSKVLESNHEASGSWAETSSDGKYLSAVYYDGEIKLWDVTEKRELWNNRHARRAYFTTFSPDQEYVLSASADGYVNEWVVENGELHRMYKHPATVRHASFSANGKYLVTGSYDNKVRLWDRANGKVIYEYSHQDWVTKTDFHENNDLFLSASYDGTVGIHSITGELKHIFEHGLEIYDASFDESQNAVYSGSSDTRLVKWSLISGELEQVFQHKDGVWRFSFANQNPWVVSASWDDTAIVWDKNTGEQLYRFEADDDFISAHFSENDEFLLTASQGKSIRLWGVKEEILFQEFTHEDGVSFSAFSTDFKHVLTAGDDGKVNMWKINEGLFELKALTSENNRGANRSAFTDSIYDNLPVNRRCLSTKERKMNFLPEHAPSDIAKKSC